MPPFITHKREATMIKRTGLIVNDVKKIQKRIIELQDLKMYFYSKNKKQNVNKKIIELKKEVTKLERICHV